MFSLCSFYTRVQIVDVFGKGTKYGVFWLVRGDQGTTAGVCWLRSAPSLPASPRGRAVERGGASVRGPPHRLAGVCWPHGAWLVSMMACYLDFLVKREYNDSDKKQKK